VLVGAWPSSGGEPVDDLDDAGLERLVETLAIPGGAYEARARARVVGCVVNRTPSGDPEAARRARQRLDRALSAHDLRLLGAVPYDRAFTEPRVRDLVAVLQPTVLSEGEQGPRRERLRPGGAGRVARARRGAARRRAR
jgi:hypothetical protein